MRTPVLNVSFVGYRSFGDRYFHVNVDVRVHDSDSDTDSQRAKPYTCYPSDSMFYGACLTNQTDAKRLVSSDFTNQLDRFYALHVEWQCGLNTLEKMKPGVKALEKVERFLDAQTKSAGAPLSMGQLVLRLANAMKIRQVYLGEDLPNPYRDPVWAARLIDESVQKWIDEERESDSRARASA